MTLADQLARARSEADALRATLEKERAERLEIIRCLDLIEEDEQWERDNPEEAEARANEMYEEMMSDPELAKFRPAAARLAS